MYLYAYRMGSFFFKTALQTKNLIINDCSNQYSFAPARLYLYKLLRSLKSKKTSVNSAISKSKIKIVLKLLHLTQTHRNFATKRSQLSFFYNFRNSRVFAAPVTKAI